MLSVASWINLPFSLPLPVSETVFLLPHPSPGYAVPLLILPCWRQPGDILGSGPGSEINNASPDATS